MSTASSALTSTPLSRRRCRSSAADVADCGLGSVFFLAARTVSPPITRASGLASSLEPLPRLRPRPLPPLPSFFFDGGFQVLNRDRVDLLMTSAFCCWRRALFMRPMFADLFACSCSCLRACATREFCRAAGSVALLRCRCERCAHRSVQLASTADQRTESSRTRCRVAAALCKWSTMHYCVSRTPQAIASTRRLLASVLHAASSGRRDKRLKITASIALRAWKHIQSTPQLLRTRTRIALATAFTAVEARAASFRARAQRSRTQLQRIRFS